MRRREFFTSLAKATLAFLPPLTERATEFVVTVPSPNAALAGAVLFVPTDGIPFAAQLVLVLGWQQQIARLCPDALCQSWWTLGGCGLVAVTLADRWGALRDALVSLWERPMWGVLTTHLARQAAAWELLRWRHDPLRWLLWHARLVAMRQPLTELDDAKPLRLTADRLNRWTRSLSSRHPLLLLLTPQVEVTDEPSGFPQTRPRPFPVKSLILPSPLPSLCHALWWAVTESEPIAGMVLGQLLGGGTGGLWFQKMRGEEPLAYHAIAGWQLTPVGGELFLFASFPPSHLPSVRDKVRGLLAALRQGNIGEQDMFRAQRLGLLRHRQLLADPMEHGMTLAAWLLAGRRVREWLALPQRLQTFSPDLLRRFCQRLPFTLTEVIAHP